MGEGVKVLPGTGRWQPKADGGGPQFLQNSTVGPLHHFVVPLPVPGRI
jgi:hypothetical protein